MLPHRRQLFALALGLSTLPFLLAQTQSEMTQSAAHDYELADRALNTTYKKLLKKLDKDSAAKLKASQLAWLAYRDADSTFAASSAQGGTLEPTLLSTHAASLTQSRTKALQAELDSPSH